MSRAGSGTTAGTARPPEWRGSVRSVLACLAAFVLAGVPVCAGQTFLESDAYKSGDEVVGVLLTDADYAKMVADVVHGEDKLDWAWVLGQQSSRKVASLGFSVDQYSSVVVAPPALHVPRDFGWLSERTREVLMIGCKRLGWSPREDGELLLATAIVDAADADGFGPVKFFNATNRHFVELEFRLAESSSGRTLLVARERAHSANMVGAVWRGVARLVRFLAEPAAPRYPAHGKSISLDLLEMPGKKKPHKFEKHAAPREILMEAMRSSGMFEQVLDATASADYGLEMHVRETNLVGAYQTTVNVLATYILRDRGSGTTVFEEDVATSTTISALEIRSGGKRLKATVAAAFLDNADNFLFRLATGWKAGPTH